MSRHLTRLIKSIRHLGMSNGISVFGSYVYHRVFTGTAMVPRSLKVRILPNGVWLRPGLSDWIVMERIFFDREYDPISAEHDRQVDQLYRTLVSNGQRPVIIDCGANIGLSAIWLALRFPASKIIAIEPEIENFKVLARNAGRYPNIVPIHAAISDTIHRVDLSNSEGTPWAWKTTDVEAGGIGTVTITTLLDSGPADRLLVVKMDIEGFETTALRDGARWADDLPLLIFEMHDWMVPWSGSGHAFFSALARTRRDYLIRGENLFSYSHAALGLGEGRG